MLEIILSVSNDEDRTFLEMVYNEYSKKLYWLSLSIVKNHYDAEEYANNTIAVAVEKVEKFKKAYDQNYLKRLLVVTCRNLSINKYNDNKNKLRHELSSSEDNYETFNINYTSADYEDNVERIIISNYNCRLIHDLINKLELKYRDVIVLRQMGFDNTEISKLMGISIELVRQRLHRAKEKMLEMGGKELYYDVFRKG